MAYILLKDYNILPKKELHWSRWVKVLASFRIIKGSNSRAHPRRNPSAGSLGCSDLRWVDSQGRARGVEHVHVAWRVCEPGPSTQYLRSWSQIPLGAWFLEPAASYVGYLDPLVEEDAAEPDFAHGTLSYHRASHGEVLHP